MQPDRAMSSDAGEPCGKPITEKGHVVLGVFCKLPAGHEGWCMPWRDTAMYECDCCERRNVPAKSKGIGYLCEDCLPSWTWDYGRYPAAEEPPDHRAGEACPFREEAPKPPPEWPLPPDGTGWPDWQVTESGAWVHAGNSTRMVSEDGVNFRPEPDADDADALARKRFAESVLATPRPCGYCGGDYRDGKTHGRTYENGPIECPPRLPQPLGIPADVLTDLVETNAKLLAADRHARPGGDT